MKTLGAGLCLLAASTFALPSADQGKPVEKGYSLQGKVVDGVSGRPIRDVRLSLADLRWQPAAEPTTPDSLGLFIFSGLAAGEYILSADGPEIGPVFFDELPEPWLVQTIHIKPEEPERLVVFRIVPRIAIGGTVRDEFGDPVERTSVTFLRPVWVEGWVVLETVQQTVTDDRGRYRVGRLPPGGYVICASVGRQGLGEAIAPMAGPVDFASRSAPRVYTQTCYPDPAASPSDFLEVRAGSG